MGVSFGSGIFLWLQHAVGVLKDRIQKSGNFQGLRFPKKKKEKNHTIFCCLRPFSCRGAINYSSIWSSIFSHINLVRFCLLLDHVGLQIMSKQGQSNFINLLSRTLPKENNLKKKKLASPPQDK